MKNLIYIISFIFTITSCAQKELTMPKAYAQKRTFFQTPDTLSVLSTAVLNNDKCAVMSLLHEPNIAVNYLEYTEKTALGYACSEGNLDIAHLLLISGANPNQKEGKRQETSLHRAVRSGNKALVRLLLGQKNIDVMSKNNNQETPLFLAATIRLPHGSCGLLNCLLNHSKIKIPVKNNLNQTFFLKAYIHNVIHNPYDLDFFTFLNKKKQKKILNNELYNLMYLHPQEIYNVPGIIVGFIELCINHGADLLEVHDGQLNLIMKAQKEYMTAQKNNSLSDDELLLKKKIFNMFCFYGRNVQTPSGKRRRCSL